MFRSEMMHYFDNAATTKICQPALDTWVKTNEKYYYNTASIHDGGKEASRLLETARRQLSSMLGVPTYECVFTSGATEGNNLVIKSMLTKKEVSGSTVLVSQFEHPSVIDTLKTFTNYNIKYIRATEQGHIDLDHLKELMSDDVVFVTVMAVNNIIGTIQPIAGIASIVSQYPKVYFHVDATQAIGKVNINYEGVDALSISSHKFYGPKGIGAVLFKQKNILRPLLHGGGHEGGLRSGTVNLPSVAAMVRALRETLESMDNVQQRLEGYKLKINDAFSQHPSIQFQPSDVPHVINMSFIGVKGEVIVNILSEKNVAVSTTSACHSNHAKPNETLLAIGTEQIAIDGSVRISMGMHNTETDVDALIDAINYALREVSEVLQ